MSFSYLSFKAGNPPEEYDWLFRTASFLCGGGRRLGKVSEETVIFVEELRGEERGVGGVFDFGAGPEAAFGDFIVVETDGGVVDAEEGEDKLALEGGFPKVGAEEAGTEALDAEFLAGLALEGVLDFLAEVDVAADGGVPTSGKEFLF